MIKKSLFYIAMLLGLTFVFKTAVAQDKKNNDAAGSKQAVYDLIARILPGKADKFEIAFIAKENDKDVFELESANGKIILQGNNGVAVASAFNYYLKNYAHCDISWNSTNLKLPATLPLVPVKIHRNTPYTYRYYLNYCTFNYSMSWWDWPRWQREIDWMALNGINMPLAITGQNSVWSRVYKSLGFTDKDLEGLAARPISTGFTWVTWMAGAGRCPKA
jgi:alpha-N-acetylglucosaminidase